MPEPVRREIVTPDGVTLAITILEPDRPAQLTALIAGGVAVPRYVYGEFGRWLASQSIRCVTFDYRGIGDSTATPEAVTSASLSAWATTDTVAVLEYVERTWPEPVALVAHSFGGQMLGLVEDLQRLHSVVLVASQCGSAQHWDGFDRLKIWALWYLILPTLAALFRVTPKVAGMRLPRGVAREWAFWGRQADWYFSLHDDAETRLARLPSPILAFTIADDWLAPPRSVTALLRRFNADLVDHRTLSPQNVGVPEIGHFGLFRDPRMQPVWEEIRSFLLK